MGIRSGANHALRRLLLLLLDSAQGGLQVPVAWLSAQNSFPVAGSEPLCSYHGQRHVLVTTNGCLSQAERRAAACTTRALLVEACRIVHANAGNAGNATLARAVALKEGPHAFRLMSAVTSASEL